MRPPSRKGQPVIVEFSIYVVDVNSINVEDMDFRYKQKHTYLVCVLPVYLYSFLKILINFTILGLLCSLKLLSQLARRRRRVAITLSLC